MAIGPLRGGGPPVAKLPTVGPNEAGQAKPQAVLEKAVDGVLKTGQGLLLPAGTGLAELADHFDAREAPKYDQFLKGESRADAPDLAPSQAQQAQAEPSAREASTTAFAAESAMAMLDLLPAPAFARAHAPRSSEVDDPDDARRRALEQRLRADGDPEPDDPEEAPVRHVELLGGLFTLDDGSLDCHQRRLRTLEAFLDGDVPFVSCAVDQSAIADGTPIRIPALDAAVGREVVLRAVHQHERTRGVGCAYLEVCVSERTPRWEQVLEQVLTALLG